MDKMGSGEIVSQVGQKHGGRRRARPDSSSRSCHTAKTFWGSHKRWVRKIAAPPKHIWWLIILPILCPFS